MNNRYPNAKLSIKGMDVPNLVNMGSVNFSNEPLRSK